MKDVMIWTGAGQIGMAIARRVGFGMKIVVGDKNIENAERCAKIMNEAGFDVEACECDISNRDSILALIDTAKKFGKIKYLVSAAGVCRSLRSLPSFVRCRCQNSQKQNLQNFA